MNQEQPVIDERALAEIRELIGDDFDGFIERFVGDAVALLEGIDRALADGDARAIEIAAHTLKSSAASVGAAALSGAARRLEASGRGHDLADAAPLLEQTRCELEQAGRALGVEVNGAPPD